MRIMSCAQDFDGLYRQWYRPVVNLCERLLGPELDAEVVAQEAFVRAWRSWGHYSVDRPFGPWVATIARRLCINESRLAERRNRFVECGVEEASDEIVDITVRRHSVQSALSRLSPRQRRVLGLRHIHGFSYAQIAGIDDVTVEAVRGTLKRARAEFRRQYESA